MGQVLAIGIGGLFAGYCLLRIAQRILRVLDLITTHPVHDNPRLRVIIKAKDGKEYVLGMAQLAEEEANGVCHQAEEARRRSAVASQDAVTTRRRRKEATCEAEEALRGEQAVQAVAIAHREHSTSEDIDIGRSSARLSAARRATELTETDARAAQQASEEVVNRAGVALEPAENAAREATFAANRAQKEAEERLKKGIQPITIPTPDEVAEAKLRAQYQEGLFHFAITGAAGNGKSSLINALRGLHNRHPDAARTGVVETTLTVGRYPDPNPQYPFAWYDIPGAGTLKQPDWLYFNAHGLFVFDCIVVLFDNRFTQIDIAILMNCRRFQIPTYIVRSKADVHIRNIMYDEGYDSDHDEGTRYEALYSAARKRFIADTRASVRRNLEEANLPDQRVYIVSNKTLMSTVKERVLSPKIIDELELMKDMLEEACFRRCVLQFDP